MKNGNLVEFNKSSWYQDGELHKEDGPAVEFKDGSKHWYLNGLRHRENGPAIEWPNRGEEWFLNGERHRHDGPAVNFLNGFQEWWINGEQLTKDEFNHWLEKKSLNEKLHSTLAPKEIIKMGKI